MSSHKNTPENIPENIIFTEEEEKALKILVQEKIKKIDINKYISIRSFFNDITGISTKCVGLVPLLSAS